MQPIYVDQCSQDPDQEPAQTVISEMQCDEDWGQTDPIQRGYAKAGLKRYKICKQGLAEDLFDKLGIWFGFEYLSPHTQLN